MLGEVLICCSNCCSCQCRALLLLLLLLLLQLANTEEFVDGQSTGMLGEVLIRCNNVLYLRGAPDDMEDS
jgi:hypothetical protein